MFKKQNTGHGNTDGLLRLPLHSEDSPPQLNSGEVNDESEFFRTNQL